MQNEHQEQQLAVISAMHSVCCDPLATHLLAVDSDARRSYQTAFHSDANAFSLVSAYSRLGERQQLPSNCEVTKWNERYHHTVLCHAFTTMMALHAVLCSPAADRDVKEQLVRCRHTSGQGGGSEREWVLRGAQWGAQHQADAALFTGAS